MRPTGILAACAALAGAAAAQESTLHAIDVVFVGASDTPRTAAFGRFLRERFRSVATADRAGADRAELLAADLVVLDWPQSDEARAQRQAHRSPLGNRDGWTVPTVLLGSAGLNLAGAWEVRGGFG